MTSIGRYDNPYRVATWDRDPPPGTVCEPLLLDTQDRALASAWHYARGTESTVAVLMHPRADFSHHYVTPGLLDAHKLLSATPGSKKVDDAWVEKVARTVYSDSQEKAAQML